MPSTQLLSRSDEINSFVGGDVIVEDVIPHSKIGDGGNECICSCTCSTCPTLFEWCIKDALGISCNFTTCCLFLYGQFVMIFVVLIPNNYSLANYIHFVLLHCLEFLALSSYYRTMFTNPGAVPLNDATPEKLRSYSHGTTIYRCTNLSTMHQTNGSSLYVRQQLCRTKQPESYTCIVSMYTLIVLYYHLNNCVATNWTACPAWSPPMTFVFVILLGLESFGFFVFTAVMTTIQFYCIYTDTTGIEFFKGQRRSSRPSMSFLCALKTVFGSRVGLQWLNPFSRPMNYITQNDEHITFDV
ncbi:unnamed protein product [Adineta ricciae]|uniref:Palmitoyltransferase n=1 Tax=Adineta ricciae TaxID=249248 RepID=A0A813QFK7_ADIRI|nr:unnamed protein product [Adineta ricciae]